MSSFLFAGGGGAVLLGMSLRDDYPRLHSWLVGVGFLTAIAGLADIFSFYEAAQGW